MSKRLLLGGPWAPLGPLGAPLGPPLGPPWVSLGPSWSHKRVADIGVCPLWGSNGVSWSLLCLRGPFWDPFRLPKGPSGDHFGPPAVPNCARTFFLVVLGAPFSCTSGVPLGCFSSWPPRPHSKATPSPPRDPKQRQHRRLQPGIPMTHQDPQPGPAECA